MNKFPNSINEVRDYVAAEIERARKTLPPSQWQALLIGMSDDGELNATPCGFVLPFHYPATIEELDENNPDHFSLPQSPWKEHRKRIIEFAEQYEMFAALDDDAQSVQASELHMQRRIAVLQDACAHFGPALTIFGFESDSESFWEVNSFHISGPRIPAVPTPISDVQVLSRLCRHTHSYIGRSRFHIQGGAIAEVSFDGADTTDATIDLLRNIPRLRELLGKLRKMSLQKTLVTSRSLKFLERELPHVEISYKHYLQI
jgi:hypothetical protein